MNTDVELLLLDDVCRKLLDRSSYVASLTGLPLLDSKDNKGFVLLDAIQQPLIGYKRNGSEQVKVISGIFTYHRIQKFVSANNTLTSVPVFLLHKAPIGEIRELLLLNEMTRNLLKQCFLGSSSQLADHLYAWFGCLDNDLFENELWLQLFPSIKTKSDLCNWLAISSKTFVPSCNRRGNE
ncbi:hypothetical protein [Tolumonas lignilytica]|uniref:hypothetical protein n=1 Tax=Tolumonas lignilytica TaxID=1283284 RepID=UPI001267DC6B|nr:hypothetical protein [Tolumonas lignilytica]